MEKEKHKMSKVRAGGEISLQEMKLETEGIELNQATQRFKECSHELVSTITEQMTYDARRHTVKETRCIRCKLYYTIDVLEKEAVQEETIQISEDAMKAFQK